MALGSINWSGFLYHTRPNSPGQPTGQSFIDAVLRGRSAPDAHDGITEADYHADVQRLLVDSLRAAGNVVEENIRLLARRDISTEWVYDVDAIFLPSCDEIPQLMEFKTSLTKFSYDDFDGSEFRRKQFEVMVLANIGGRVSTRNNRALNVRITPSVPIPAMGVIIVYAIPNKNYDWHYIAPGDFKRLLELAD